MEGVQEGYPGGLIAYTSVKLPNPGETATSGPQRADAREHAALGRDNVFVPLRGDPASGWGARAEAAIRRSPYERMYDLTQTLTADQPTAYAAVKNVERYLQDTFTYSERVPTRPIPLMGFLYEDKRGYCQQFSGAMALMLRMAGIPARVAAGFSPGSYNKDTGEYRVRDLDAHSWVEVWFTGIGWVPFDPTPARSPAQSQSSALATSAAAADAGEVRQRQGVAASDRVTDSGGGLGSDGGNGWLGPLLLLLLAAPLVAGRVPHRKSYEAPSWTRTGRAGRGPALGAPARARAAGLGRPSVDHAAGTRAAARALRGSGVGGLCKGPARAPLRPARAGGARPGPAQGGAQGAKPRQPFRQVARPRGHSAGRATSIDIYRNLRSAL